MVTTDYWDDKYFNKSLAESSAGHLKNIHTAISDWVNFAMKELADRSAADRLNMTKEQLQWYNDYQDSQEFMLVEVINALYAGLSVSISSSVENFMGTMCEEYNLKLGSKPDWGNKRTALESRLSNKKFDDLADFSMADRVRLLSNCYKHEGGKTNTEWVKKFGGTEGEEIDYPGESWTEMIEGVRNFLLAMVDALP
jgi:hypothetical protein